MECARKRCGKPLKGRQKKWHSASCRVLASRERNYRKVVRRTRRPVGERPLNARERRFVAAIHRILSKVADLYGATLFDLRFVVHA